MASDVYSAGCVLYHLLTGRTPLQLASLAPEDRPAAIREQTPMAASAAALRAAVDDPLVFRFRDATPSQLHSALRGGLDAILAAALAKNPAHRYATARELLLEIELLRAGRTPRKKPRGLAGRTLGFVRSYPLPFATAGLIAATVYGEWAVYGFQRILPSQAELARRHFMPLIRDAGREWQTLIPRLAAEPRFEHELAEARRTLDEARRLTDEEPSR